MRSHDRLDIIHVGRGLAALVVCLLHINTATTYMFPRPLQFVSALGHLGVPVFFTISGFVVPYSLVKQGYTLRQFFRYLARRMVRLDPPYLVVVAITLAMIAVRSARSHAAFPYSATDIALHLGYLSGLAGRPWVVSVFWTLGIEFQFYILVGLCFGAGSWLAAFVLRSPWARFWSMMLVFVALDLIGRRFFQPWMGDDRYGALWLFHQPHFWVGICAFVVRLNKLPAWTIVLFSVLMLVWTYGIPGVTRVPILSREVIQSLVETWTVLMAFGMAMVLLPSHVSLRDVPYLGPALIGLGTISFSLYVTHLLLAGALSSRLTRYGPYTAFLTELAACLALATVFWWGVERPALAFSRRIRFRETASPAK